MNKLIKLLFIPLIFMLSMSGVMAEDLATKALAQNGDASLLTNIHPFQIWVKPDGKNATTDDGYRGAFNNVTNAANKLKNGDSLIIFPGTYEIQCVYSVPVIRDHPKSTFHLESLTNIAIVGLPGAHLKTLTPENVGSMLTYENCQNVDISGLTFQGQTNLHDNWLNASNYIHTYMQYTLLTGCIMSTGSNDLIKIHNNIFYDWPDQCISHVGYSDVHGNTFESVSRLIVEDNVAYNIGSKQTDMDADGDGTFISGCMTEGCVVRRNILNNVTSFFEYGGGGEDATMDNIQWNSCVIQGNIVSNIFGWCIWINVPRPGNSYNNIEISDNIFDFGTIGKPATDSPDVTIFSDGNNVIVKNNIILNAHYYGLRVGSKYTGLTSAVISGNTINNSGRTAIRVLDSTGNARVRNATITGNTITDWGSLYPFIYFGAENTLFSGNQINRTVQGGDWGCLMEILNGDVTNLTAVQGMYGYVTNTVIANNQFNTLNGASTSLLRSNGRTPLGTIRLMNNIYNFTPPMPIGSFIDPSGYVGWGTASEIWTNIFYSVPYTRIMIQEQYDCGDITVAGSAPNASWGSVIWSTNYFYSAPYPWSQNTSWRKVGNVGALKLSYQ